jgi:hypothetical protein
MGLFHGPLQQVTCGFARHQLGPIHHQRFAGHGVLIQSFAEKNIRQSHHVLHIHHRNKVRSVNFQHFHQYNHTDGRMGDPL